MQRGQNLREIIQNLWNNFGIFLDSFGMIVLAVVLSVVYQILISDRRDNARQVLQLTASP